MTLWTTTWPRAPMREKVRMNEYVSIVLGSRLSSEEPKPSGMTRRSFDSPALAVSTACSLDLPDWSRILNRADSRPVSRARDAGDPSWSRAEMVWTPTAFWTSFLLTWPMKLKRMTVKASEMMSCLVTSSLISLRRRLANLFI